MIQSVTFLYQTTEGKAYIDDNYSIQDEVTWKKYVPTIEKDILLSDFEVPSSVQIIAPSDRKRNGLYRFNIKWWIQNDRYITRYR